MKRVPLILLPLLLVTLLLGGCGTTGPTTGEEGAAGAAGGAAGAGSGAETSAAAAGGAWTGSPLDDPNSPLYEKVVYFDFDRSEIRPEFLPMLRAHADYLINTPSARLVIEGHCDERGSREYNIALGERRANAVKRFLEAEGVSPLQLETISYGEERPAVPGHNEEAWAKNRRAELVYQ